jgi:hypothetical protein
MEFTLTSVVAVAEVVHSIDSSVNQPPPTRMAVICEAAEVATVASTLITDAVSNSAGHAAFLTLNLKAPPCTVADVVAAQNPLLFAGTHHHNRPESSIKVYV